MTSCSPEIIDLLERAIDGKLTLDEITVFMSTLTTDDDEMTYEAAHQIMHFVTDEDIRAKDNEYNALMQGNLRKYIKHFRK